MSKINSRNLQKMIDEKYISVQKHPELDLYIYNYTQSAQFDRVWNNETLQCRGLIMDKTGKIVARPFPKFFNLEELEAQGIQLPLEDFEVFDKLDGSLGILYRNAEGTPCIATRGSFTSDQAIKGTEILQKYIQIHGKDIFLQENTYLFEIIYPQNRIVVDYGKTEDLYLLAVVNTYTGTELPYRQIISLYDGILPIVKRYDGIADYKEFASHPRDNSEGYVIKFKDNQRVKIKFDEYKRIHRLVTGLNARRIWECLKEGQSVEDMCYRVPDEFYNFVQKASQMLKKRYRDLEVEMLNTFAEVEAMGFEGDERIVRKQKAMEYLKHPQVKGLLFMMLDNKDYREELWNMIRPGADRPFKEDEA